jgi:hypothetical protein
VKIGDVIRIPPGALRAFKMRSDIGIVVGTLSRKDDLPDDFEIMVDGLIHRMGSQLQDNAEIINEAG